MDCQLTAKTAKNGSLENFQLPTSFSIAKVHESAVVPNKGILCGLFAGQEDGNFCLIQISHTLDYMYM